MLNVNCEVKSYLRMLLVKNSYVYSHLVSSVVVCCWNTGWLQLGCLQWVHLEIYQDLQYQQMMCWFHHRHYALAE